MKDVTGHPYHPEGDYDAYVCTLKLPKICHMWNYM